MEGFQVWNPGQWHFWELIRGQRDDLNLILLIYRVSRWAIGGWKVRIHHRVAERGGIVSACVCTDTCMCVCVCRWHAGSKQNLSRWWMASQPGHNSALETVHVCVRSAEKALIRPITGLPLSERGACALHPNVLIYSSLKLNAAVNAPSDSITLSPGGGTEEGLRATDKVSERNRDG